MSASARPSPRQLHRESFSRADDGIDTVSAADPTFANLPSDHTSQWELVQDSGMGTVLVAIENEEGNVEWRPAGDEAALRACRSDREG